MADKTIYKSKGFEMNESPDVTVEFLVEGK